MTDVILCSELRTATSGSWLGRFWSRGSTPAAIATTPGPVKANLGDQSSFYYDKDLKRWVNKKVRVITQEFF